ncbi:hypothetical protein SAMN05216532_8313 [Streptomyces sp. 2231.1]|nr:hypothetical protein SAMN05216532_8313 [Streptomyces sp. 2231.1]
MVPKGEADQHLEAVLAGGHEVARTGLKWREIPKNADRNRCAVPTLRKPFIAENITSRCVASQEARASVTTTWGTRPVFVRSLREKAPGLALALPALHEDVETLPSESTARHRY